MIIQKSITVDVTAIILIPILMIIQRNRRSRRRWRPSSGQRAGAAVTHHSCRQKRLLLMLTMMVIILYFNDDGDDDGDDQKLESIFPRSDTHEMKVCPHQEVALCCSLNFVVCLDDENGNGDVVVLSMAKLRSTMKKKPILKASIKDNSRTSRRLVLSPVLVSNSHEQEYCRSAQVTIFFVVIVIIIFPIIIILTIKILISQSPIRELRRGQATSRGVKQAPAPPKRTR